MPGNERLATVGLTWLMYGYTLVHPLEDHFVYRKARFMLNYSSSMHAASRYQDFSLHNTSCRQRNSEMRLHGRTVDLEICNFSGFHTCRRCIVESLDEYSWNGSTTTHV